MKEIEIENGILTACDNEIESITIPKEVKSIKPFALGYNLCEILVDKENEHFTSVDGVLYTKNMKALVKYPRRKAGRLYEVPSSVTQIGKYAFSFCEHLVSVKMPDSLNKISEDAFSNMWSLKKIKIPKGVKRIPKSCFLFCNKLRKVVFHNKIERICPAAFIGCEKLKKINLPESLVKIEAIAFFLRG